MGLAATALKCLLLLCGLYFITETFLGMMEKRREVICMDTQKLTLITD